MNSHPTSNDNGISNSNNGNITPSSRPLINRSNAMRKLGVTETDVHIAEKVLSEPHHDTNTATATSLQKAFRMLGRTESEFCVDKAKILGSLGMAGRERSFHPSVAAKATTVAVVKRASIVAERACGRMSTTGRTLSQKLHLLL